MPCRGRPWLLRSQECGPLPWCARVVIRVLGEAADAPGGSNQRRADRTANVLVGMVRAAERPRPQGPWPKFRRARPPATMEFS
jgi:hypothetical protein